MSEYQIVVVGAGISGCLAAIRLSDAGFDVVLADRTGTPMAGTSRWNEGKIHLGYCYMGDATLSTAQKMLDGAACFVDDIEKLTGRELRSEWFTQPVVYVVDPETQFPVDQLLARSERLAKSLVERSRLEPGLRRYAQGEPALRRLDTAAASNATGLDRIAAAWLTSERCVAPGPVAELISTAVRERRIPVLRADVRRIARQGSEWMVNEGGDRLKCRVVVNASWESRVRLDRDAVGAAASCSIRYKYALFGSGLGSMTRFAPSTRIVGRFGDITPYGNGEAYLSWYPANFAGLSDDGNPPMPAAPDPDAMIGKTVAGLGLSLDALEPGRATWEVRGGYIVAHGSGDIDRASSPLHFRDRIGASELAPGYISVDTGKYSCGPLHAARAALLAGRRIAGPAFELPD